MSAAKTDSPTTVESPRLVGVLAQFDSSRALLDACRRVREKGFTRWEAFAPFPVHGLDDAMGAKPTRLPWIVLIMGLTGTSLALFLVWWTNATSFKGVPSFLQGYPYVVSGKPIFSLPANVPILFELTVLLSAIGAAIGMLVLNGLPRLYNPLFKSRAFRQVTTDRFFIMIQADDPNFERSATDEFLRSLGASHCEDVED